MLYIFKRMPGEAADPQTGGWTIGSKGLRKNTAVRKFLCQEAIIRGPIRGVFKEAHMSTLDRKNYHAIPRKYIHGLGPCSSSKTLLCITSPRAYSVAQQ